MPSVLIIDDETSLVSSLSFALRADGYQAEGAGTGAEGLAAVERLRPDVVLLDLRLPDGSGLDWLERLRAAHAETPVIMISAHGETRSAVRAVKLGAFDYLTKPFELDDLFVTLRSALERERLTQELSRYREVAAGVGDLIGESEPMQRLREEARKVGASNASRVLLLGESGTGKALVARAVHKRSSRAAGPFIEVNCAALPEQLVEAELFGAEKGAYTGAHQRRTGLVTLADGGTLFLDEVGELPLQVQSKLLHFLEDGSYRAVGAGRPQASDARIVAATNRDLAAEVRAGRFREDLFYRLDVVRLRVPPLRERGRDVLLLAGHFAARFAREEKCPVVSFTPEAEAVLLGYPWPGNVRELRNLVERLTILNVGRAITAAELPKEISSAQPRPAHLALRSIDADLAETEQLLLKKALAEANGHRGRAAEILGISRHALKRRLQRLGLS
ncbi:MAG TPA: sigma-54 dependent transcriptional regulator [Anaeromyxobacteraceae bacterium]|jgi:DNA-binding NtrC family response regulator|nr:sigma-54 dependent transcriptional regulator [Anaeromyxobacteraceae bacterium]